MTTLPQDQVNGAFAHGAPVLAKPTHGGIIPTHGGVVKPQHGATYIVAVLFTVLSSASVSYAPGRTVLSSAGTPYVVPGAVLSSSGTPYNVI